MEQWHATLDRTLPTRLVPGFERRFSVVTEEVAGFPVHVVTPRHRDPDRTIFYVHGGGFMAPIDPFHVRYVAGLASSLGARVVLPDYPLAPEHSWRDSYEPLVGPRRPVGGRVTGDAGRRLRRRGLRAGAGARAPRPRRAAAERAAAGLAVGRPDDLDARTPRPTTRSTRGSSSARSTRTPSGGPARPTTWAGPRSARGSATSRDCRAP